MMSDFTMTFTTENLRRLMVKPMSPRVRVLILMNISIPWIQWTLPRTTITKINTYLTDQQSFPN